MLVGGIDPTTGAMTVLQGKSLMFEVRPIRRCLQVVKITGEPTGGGLQLVVRGGTTALIAYDSTAAAVQALLENVAPVGKGNVRVTGGAGPSSPWSVEFLGAFAGAVVPAMTATGVTLSGGTTPDVSISVASPGGPLLAGGGWSASCQLRADYADNASGSPLLEVSCTIDDETGLVRGDAAPEDTDVVVASSGRYEIEATNGTDVVRILAGAWTLDRTVVRP